MKTLVISIFSLVFTNLANAQVVDILNQESQEGIEYAHIIYLHNGQIKGGTYSDKNGHAFLVFPLEVDTVEITCLGFAPKKIYAKKLPKKILLESTEILLEEVLVYPNAADPIQFLGIKKERGAQSSSAFEGFQIVTFIENKFQEKKKIKSFLFQIKKSKTDDDAKLKVIFFENNQGTPGKKIDKEVLLAIGEISQSKVEVGLDSLDMFLPANGFFIGIEWMGCVDDKSQKNSEQCNLSIITNNVTSRKLNQTFVRNVFKSTDWSDINKGMLVDYSQIPIFGIYVYE